MQWTSVFSFDLPQYTVIAMTTVKMNYLHALWMYRTWMRKYSQPLQKTTQSRPLPSYSSSIDWRARSRRTTSPLLKTNVTPAPRTPVLSWTHQFLRRYFWKQFSVLPVNNIIDFKWKGWHVYNNNNNNSVLLMWKHCSSLIILFEPCQLFWWPQLWEVVFQSYEAYRSWFSHPSRDPRTLLERTAFSTSSLVFRATDWMTKGAPYWIARATSLLTPLPPPPHL